MNKFQREVVKRRKRVFKTIGLGDFSKRIFTKWIREKLKEDLKNKSVKM